MTRATRALPTSTIVRTLELRHALWPTPESRQSLGLNYPRNWGGGVPPPPQRCDGVSPRRNRSGTTDSGPSRPTRFPSRTSRKPRGSREVMCRPARPSCTRASNCSSAVDGTVITREIGVGGVLPARAAVPRRRRRRRPPPRLECDPWCVLKRAEAAVVGNRLRAAPIQRARVPSR
jgi:hypothetical protein